MCFSACRLKTSDDSGDEESPQKDIQKMDKDILVSGQIVEIMR